MLTKRIVGQSRNGFAEADQLRQFDTRPWGTKSAVLGHA